MATDGLGRFSGIGEQFLNTKVVNVSEVDLWGANLSTLFFFGAKIFNKTEPHLGFRARQVYRPYNMSQW